MLATAGVNTRRIAAAGGFDAERREHAHDTCLQRSDERAHADACPSHVDHRVNHELPGAVVGHLPAAVDLHQRNIAGCQHVLSACGHAERKHGRMFRQPEFVRRRRITRIGERLHAPPQRLIVLPPEFADDAGGPGGFSRRR